MALKHKLDSLDGLDDATKALYKKVGDKFVLDVEGMDDGDLAGLKAQNEKLLAEKKAAEKKAREDAEAARLANEDAAKKAGNIDALEKSWQQKLADREKELQAKYETDVGSLTSDVNRLLIDNVAATAARDLAIQGSDGLLLPHIQARLRVDVRDGKRTTVVVDAKGQPSALTLDDLKKEISGNPAFAPVIAGSKASGGGAGGANGGGAAGAKTMKRSEFDALPPPDRVARMNEGVTLTD
jgi:hypothetical protein